MPRREFTGIGRYSEGFTNGYKEGYTDGFGDGMKAGAGEPAGPQRRMGLGPATVSPRGRKRKLSAWNKFVKANSKKPRFIMRSGKLNLKKMGVAFRKKKR